MLLANYIAEPMMGEAACCMMNGDFDNQLTSFVSLLKSGDLGISFSKGNAGEFVVVFC